MTSDFSRDGFAGYHLLCLQLAALLEGEQDLIANLSNTSALLWQSLPDLNWAGFYLLRNGELLLGPFQGKPACVHIALGKGVCGRAAALNATQLVADVHQFPGHIPCDGNSRSELVVPLRHGGRVVGVLDLDSPSLSRFEEEDRTGLEDVALLLEKACCWDYCISPPNGNPADALAF